MIRDDLTLLSSAQVLTGITDTSAVSTNTIDLGVARDIGEGEDLYMIFQLPTAVTNGTSTKFEAIVASDASLSADIAVIGDTGAIATASLTQYAYFAVRLRPLVGLKGQRYLGARYTVVGTNNAGTVTTFITKDLQDGKKFYTSGFSIT